MTDSKWLKEHGFVETKCRKCGIDVIEPKEHLTHYCGECHQKSIDMSNAFEREQNRNTIIFVAGILAGILLLIVIPIILGELRG